MRELDAIKKTFREGRRAEALKQCEAICLRFPHEAEPKRLCALMHGMMGNFAESGRLLREILATNPDDAHALFNSGVCEREQNHFTEAEHLYTAYTTRYPDNELGWANLAECQFQLQRYPEALQSAKAAIALNPASTQALVTQGDCFRALQQHDDALLSYAEANRLQPNALACLNQGLVLIEIGRLGDALAALGDALRIAPTLLAALSNRADTFNFLGRVEEAVNDYREVLRHKPDDEDALQKISSCLVKLNRGGEALQLFRDALKVQPSLLTAKLGITWVISQMIPAWHLPMMNEWDRNNAYHKGMQAAITPGQTVLEIGTGSGLLSMMAAKLGARSVVTCEAVSLIAETARKIIAQNNFQDRIAVHAKPSFALQLGRDLAQPADLLVHEIFSSELLGEHVLPAIEDAKLRLLKPGARICPGVASIMVALVGGDDLGMYLYVKDSFGFDLQAFNAITPRKIPLYRDDLNPQLLSADTEAFRFDFMNASSFPRESRTLDMVATGEGLCFGVIQWIRMEFDDQIMFENHPSRTKSVSNWQRTIFCFDAPITLKAGVRVSVTAAHDRSTPWFDLAVG